MKFIVCLIFICTFWNIIIGMEQEKRGTKRVLQSSTENLFTELINQPEIIENIFKDWYPPQSFESENKAETLTKYVKVASVPIQEIDEFKPLVSIVSPYKPVQKAFINGIAIQCIVCKQQMAGSFAATINELRNHTCNTPQ